MTKLTIITFATALALAACGSPTQGPGTGLVPQYASAQTHGRSWMLPEAKKENLLYFSGSNKVSVYSYPGGKLVGTLLGLGGTNYDCSDKNGNVFIASVEGSNQGIYEFAHGGTQPINFLPLSEAGTCSVDPTTGNLGVIQSFGDNVYVYANAQGTPNVYNDPDIFELAGFTYDGSGNLFVGGAANNKYRTFTIVELPHGSSTFEPIHFQGTYNGDGYQPLVWDGKYLGLGSLQLSQHRDASITVVNQIELSGSTGTIVGQVPLGPQHAAAYPQWAIHNGVAIEPSNNHNNGTSYFSYFKYPGGKKLRKVKMPGVYPVIGTTLSIAPSH